MGGHDGKNSGWGNRDQDFGDPMPDPALADGADDMTGKPAHDRGKVAGAEGKQPPHQNIKPGTKLDLEEKL